MAWLEAVLLFAGVLVAGAGIGLMHLERMLAGQAGQLQSSSALLLEVRRLHQHQQALATAQRLTEATIDGGAATVRAVHLGIAAIPFGVLEAIPVTRDVSRVVRQTHDLIAEAVYGSIRGANRAVGSVARGVLAASAGTDTGKPAASESEEPRKP